jgi:hypothetical protein
MLLVYLMRLADDNLQAEFFLEQGRMTNAIERRLKANEHFRTRTPMAITGIRGTEFRIRLEDEQSSVVETLKGKVALSAAGKNVLVRKGQGVRVKKGQPPAQPRPLPPAPPLPELQPVYRTIPIQITVPAQKNRSAFHLRITSDEKGLDTLVDQTVKPGGTFSIASLQDGIYFLFLSAIDRQGFESAPAGPAHLKIRTTPGAPIISSPDNGQKFFEKTVKIRWVMSDDAIITSCNWPGTGNFPIWLTAARSRKASISPRNLRRADIFSGSGWLQKTDLRPSTPPCSTGRSWNNPSWAACQPAQVAATTASPCAGRPWPT